MNTYHPIPCALHDKYEIAIMHRAPLKLKWQDEDNQLRTETIQPKDILIKNREEFLVAVTQENIELIIRLDKITLLED